VQFKIELHIGFQFFESFDPVLYSSHCKAWQFLAFKKGSNDASFSFREDVCSHFGSFISNVGKVLNSFYPYNRDCRVGASKDGAKNSTRKKSEEGKTRGKT